MVNSSLLYVSPDFHPGKLTPITLAVYQLFLSIAMILGIPGNSLVIWTLFRMHRKSPMDYIITFMSVCDLIPLLTVVPVRLSESTKLWFVYGTDWLCKGIVFIGQVTTWSSAFILVITARERYLRVCRNKAVVQTGMAARKICLKIVVVTVVMGVPHLMFSGINAFGTCGTPTYVNKLVYSSYIVVLALTTIITLIIIFISYYLIAKRVWTHSKQFEINTSRRITLSKELLELKNPVCDKTELASNSKPNSLPVLLRSNKVSNTVGCNTHKNDMLKHAGFEPFKQDATEVLNENLNTVSSNITDSSLQEKQQSRRDEVIQILNQKQSVFFTNRTRKQISDVDIKIKPQSKKSYSTDCQECKQNSNASPRFGGCNQQNSTFVSGDQLPTKHIANSHCIVSKPHSHFITVQAGSSSNKGQNSPHVTLQNDTNPIQVVSKSHSAKNMNKDGEIGHKSIHAYPSGTKKVIKRNKDLAIKTTRILFSVTLVFFLSWIPLWIAFMIVAINGTKLTLAIYQAYVFMVRTHFLSLFMNPILYYFLNKKFKEELWKLFGDIKVKVQCSLPHLP